MILPVIAGQLPTGFCATDYQSILNEFSAHQTVEFTTASGITVVASASKPTDTTVAWLRLDQFGRPERIYWFASGAWLSLHPLVPGLTQWWFDSLPNFTTFDGGDALAISVISGPMWQKAKNSDGVEIAAKFPVAAGTLPSMAILAQGATGGEELHVLSASEMNHYHGFGDGNNAGVDGVFCARSWSSAIVGTGTHNIDTTAPAATGPAIATGILGTSDSIASGVPSVGHNTMPVFVVGYLLQRTAKLFYAIP